MQDLRSPTELALDAAKDHLLPFVTGILWTQTSSGTLLDKVNRDLKKSGDKLYPSLISQWNIEHAFSVLERYTFAFDTHLSNNRIIGRDRLLLSVAGWANTLFTFRNRWAHRNDYGDDDALHFIGATDLLLETCGFTEAALELRAKTTEYHARRFSGETPERVEKAEQLIADIIAKLSEGRDQSTDTPSWSEFASKAIQTPALRIIRMSQTRALGPMEWKEQFGIPQFAQTDLIRAELDLDLYNLEHAPSLFSLWLVVDSEQVTCLCPNSAIAPDCEIKGALFTIPPPGISKPLAFYGAKGKHALYVILTESSLPERLYGLLQSPQPIAILDEIAAATQSLPDLMVLKTKFLVN